MERGRFPRHALDEHADGHAGREAMGVEQDVGSHAALTEGHVLGRPQAAQDALLAVAAGKLVADGGVARNTHRDAHALEAARTHVVTAHFYVVHYTAFLTPGEQKKMVNQ